MLKRIALLTPVLMFTLSTIWITPGSSQILFEEHFTDCQTQLNRFPCTVLLSIQVPEIKMVEVKSESRTFVDISIQGAGVGESIGRSKLPVMRKVIEIPENAEITLKTEVDSQTISLEYPILPLTPSVLRMEGTKRKFVMDTDFYKLDKFFPDVWAKVSRIGYIRGRRVIFLDIYPVRYSPKTNTIIYANKIIITLKLKGSNEIKTERRISRYYSPVFENLQRKIIINYETFNANPDSQIGYLIICADDYENEMLPFKQWKEDIGFVVTMVKTSEIPGAHTAEGIKAYIKDAYTNWNIPPTYVLLVGDIEDIPASAGFPTGTATDLYYTTMSDSDYIPDIFIGRLSCRDTIDVKAMVDKILYYEANLGTEEWYNWAYFISTTDENLHAVAEGIHRYSMGLWREHGGKCDSLWGWYGTGTPIDMAVNNGQSIVVYSGHGRVWAWEGPAFGKNDIDNLSNSGMYPFVCSHACYTGDYSSTECLGEKWVRVKDKGAVAFLGASNYASCGLDSIFQEGMFNAIFYDTLLYLAGMINRAKYKMYEVWGDAGMTQYYYEVYNLLGDPSMILCQLDFPGLSEISNDQLQHIFLEIYPNPFRQMTEIRYSLDPEVLGTEGRITDDRLQPAPLLRLHLGESGARPGIMDNRIQIKIYDMAGRLVKLFSLPSAYSLLPTVVSWDGRDNKNKEVSTGIYFCRLETSDYTATKKIVLIK